MRAKVATLPGRSPPDRRPAGALDDPVVDLPAPLGTAAGEVISGGLPGEVYE
jgi:hypothetical protein